MRCTPLTASTVKAVLSTSRPVSVSQCGLTAHVPGPVVVDVRVVVRLHLYLDLRHRAGDPSAQRHGRRRGAGDLQVECDAEEGQCPVTKHTAKMLRRADSQNQQKLKTYSITSASAHKLNGQELLGRHQD